MTYTSSLKTNMFAPLDSFWIMRSQRSRRRDKGLWRSCVAYVVMSCIGAESFNELVSADPGVHPDHLKGVRATVKILIM